MKNLKTLVVLACIATTTLSTAFAAYTPTMQLEKKIDAVSMKLTTIVENQFNWDFNTVLSVLEKFESKVQGNERNEWILETLQANLKSDMKSMMMNKDSMMKDEMKHGDDMMKGTELENVVGITTLRWVSFDGEETGYAYTEIKNGNTHVHASFKDLPDTGSENFYEGWIVRTSPLSVVSTGELEMKDGMLVNSFDADSDISDHTFYVLTLEPRDNDPAPADHILEGNV